MKSMAEGLGRDPQVESLLRARTQQLGIQQSRDTVGLSLGDALARSLSPGRSMGMGR
jgi:hypothetical protein